MELTMDVILPVCFPPEAICNLKSLQIGGKKKKKISQKAGTSTIIHDATYYKMNDLMFEPGQQIRESNAMSRLILRYGGFSNTEIDQFIDKNGYIRMPVDHERLRKKQTSKDFPQPDEIASLEGLLPPLTKIDFNR